MTTISVLIPTYNAEKDIGNLLNMLENQKLSVQDQLEIVIIDSSSTDNTKEIVENQYPQVIYETIKNSDFDHGGTRNILASKASGEYLLFMTQDAIPYDEYLIKNLLGNFENKKVVISYARQIPKDSATDLEKFARNFNYPNKSVFKTKNSLKELGIKTFFNSNVCSMYKKSFFDSVEGFPEKIILNEDMIVASKAILSGNIVAYSASAKVYHSHNYSLIQQFKRYFDIGMAFNQTEYLLRFASNEAEGKKMVVTQCKYLVGKRLFHLIPLAIVEAIFKYVGYILGKNHSLFSNGIKRKLSAYMK